MRTIALATRALAAGVSQAGTITAYSALEENEIALFESLEPLEVASHLREVPDVLVPHDERRPAERQLVLAHVGATDAGDLHFQQRGIRRDLRQIEFAELRRRRRHLQGSKRLSRIRHVS